MSISRSAQSAMRCLPTGLLSLLLCGLIGCTTAARQEVSPTTAPAATLAPTVVIAQAATPPAATATATRLAPSPTPRPPAETPPRATPSAAGSGDPASPSGLEPTATPTATPPTPSPTPTPVPTSSIVPGWLTYENKFLGYSFSYPPEGTIGHHGTTEIPPENVTTRREYLAWEETVTLNNLCVGVGYKTGFVTVGPMDETLSLYASPCGITGIGDYTIENWEEDIMIDGRPYTAGGYRLYIWETDQLEEEFYILLDVNDSLRIDFGIHKMGATRSGQPEVSEQEFNEIRETLLQILASFRFFAPQTGDE